MKSLKSVKKKEENAKGKTNDAESTNYTKKNPSISKVEKNKTLLSMIGMEKPQDEKFKKLGVSTLERRRRLQSAKQTVEKININLKHS